MEKAAINRIVILCVLLFLLAGWGHALAQTVSPLERIVSIELKGESSQEALKRIEAEGNFHFAYKTDMVDATNSLHRSYKGQTVREVLNDIFQGTMIYKERGDYIILRAAPKPASQEITLEGYIIDSGNSGKIAYASVYDTLSLTSTVSDVYGYYKIRLSTREDIVIRVRREGYRDTTFRWTGEMPNTVYIPLTPLVSEQPTDSVQVDTLSNFFQRFKNKDLIQLSDEQKANLINFKDRLKRSAQFSVVPGVGTNGKLSSVTTVDYSFNLLGGFNGGVRVAEIGGLFNMVWDSVSYFQLAGLMNLVEGPVTGAQIGGLVNLDNDRLQGAQIGGLVNRVAKDVRGVQVAGLVNLSRHVRGAQVAGLVNQTGDSSRYVQVGGLVNNAGHGFRGVQLAGLYNGQLTGGRGLQLAGLVNHAGPDFQGVQISGLVNHAATMKGVQIGFININDSIAGTSIGFFNYSRKGLHQLELSATESFAANLAFRSGNYHFYNIFSTGGQFSNSSRPVWRFGYGVGSSVKLSEKSRLYIDLTSHLLYQNGEFQLNRALQTIDLTYQYQLSSKIGLAVGPTLNLLMDYDVANNPTGHLTDIAPYTVYKDTWGSTEARAWVGGKVALRFF